MGLGTCRQFNDGQCPVGLGTCRQFNDGQCPVGLGTCRQFNDGQCPIVDLSNLYSQMADHVKCSVHFLLSRSVPHFGEVR